MGEKEKENEILEAKCKQICKSAGLRIDSVFQIFQEVQFLTDSDAVERGSNEVRKLFVCDMAKVKVKENSIKERIWEGDILCAHYETILFNCVFSVNFQLEFCWAFELCSTS